MVTMYPATFASLLHGVYSWEQQLSRRCEALATPEVWTTALAAFVVVGILVSYLPQHFKIIGRRSSEGLSPWWILLGGLSSIAAAGNIVTLPASREDVKCCSELSGGACAAALLGVAQIGVQWLGFMILIVLYLAFYKAADSELDDEDLAASTASLNPSKPSQRFDTVVVGCTIFLSLFIVTIVSLILVAAFPQHTQVWADILGVVSGVLAAVQYLPQIYHTWVLKDMKSLSILTLIVQAPGAFVFALSLGLRVGPDGWSTWLVYLVTGTLQFVLLAMAVSWWWTAKQDTQMSPSEVEDTGHENGATEHSPLLPNNDQSR